MSNKEMSYIVGAFAIVLILTGGIYALTNTGQQIANIQSVHLATANGINPIAAVADPALCGNGVVDEGEDCDTAHLTSFLKCNSDCTQSYTDELECFDSRHNALCLDDLSNPVTNYYDCVDAQYVYCQNLTY